MVIDFWSRYQQGLESLLRDEEVWHEHPECKVRLVSNMGRVRSVERTVRQGITGFRVIPDTVLKLHYMDNGYLACGTPGGITTLVHRLVLQTFLGPCPKGMECRHLDGTRDNNRLDNLLWGTAKENDEDRRRHGTLPEGEKSYKAKFANSNIVEIHNMYREGKSATEIARNLGVSNTTINDILHGRTYKCAQPEDTTVIRTYDRAGEKNSRARFITYQGRTQILKDWAAELDIDPNTLRDRLKAGTVEEALSHGRKRKRRGG